MVVDVKLFLRNHNIKTGKSSFKSKEEALHRFFEEYAYVLDYLPQGRPLPNRPFATPTIQIIGENYFILLEAELKPGTTVSIHERVYIGKEKREKVSKIINKIDYNSLTAVAKAELPSVLEEIVKNQEKKFVEFFNKAQPITPRMHSLELLPSIGKKTMWQIINEREKKPFESFDDIRSRVGIDPLKLIVKRILEELSGNSKYRLFIKVA
jgi:putative nucleotide binding protein